MTDDLISRKSVLDWLSPYLHIGERVDPEELVEDIRQIKAVDSAPVVRCKNCKWFRSGVNMVGNRITNCDLLCIMNDCAENSYCCWGERKDHD